MQRKKRRKKKAIRHRTIPIPFIRCADHPEISIIIPVMNESRTLPKILVECNRIQGEKEVIIVVNGSKDRSRKIAQHSGARVLYFQQALGHDVGRSIGAKHAKGNILLFLDGDIVISHADLQKFIDAVRDGIDIALNAYQGPVRTTNVHSVILAKHSLNQFCSRSDLKGASMTTIPHAISREALLKLGEDKLVVPPLAQAAAFLNGLNVEAVHHVSVGKENPKRRKKPDPLEKLIFGDHLEAIAWYLSHTDTRGFKTDLGRLRKVVNPWINQGHEENSDQQDVSMV